MRIAIDGRELVGQATGVGRYLSQLLVAWNTLDAARAHQFVICAHAAPALPSTPHLQISTIVTAGSGGTVWEQLVLPRLVDGARVDVLFAPAYSAPLRGATPVVLTVHDVSFFAHPAWFSWREGVRRRVVTRRAAARASRVLTLTEFSKDELVRRVGVPAGRIDVIPLGPSGLNSGTPGAQAREPLVLYVGSILARRHVDVLVAAFGRLAERHPDLRLVIAGDARGVGRDELHMQIRHAGVSDRVTVTGFVTDAELAAFYRRASAFAFLSSYEGFGLTPLDAIAAGVPPVVLDTAAAREVYGPAAHYVPRPEPALVEAALERVLFDAPTRAALMATGPGVLGQYSWDRTARATLAAIAEAAR
jgi:glycosyltransferase involved in cell wall biosynthesis